MTGLGRGEVIMPREAGYSPAQSTSPAENHAACHDGIGGMDASHGVVARGLLQ